MFSQNYYIISGHGSLPPLMICNLGFGEGESPVTIYGFSASVVGVSPRQTFNHFESTARFWTCETITSDRPKQRKAVTVRNQADVNTSSMSRLFVREVSELNTKWSDKLADSYAYLTIFTGVYRMDEKFAEEYHAAIESVCTMFKGGLVQFVYNSALPTESELLYTNSGWNYIRSFKCESYPADILPGLLPPTPLPIEPTVLELPAPISTDKSLIGGNIHALKYEILNKRAVEVTQLERSGQYTLIFRVDDPVSTDTVIPNPLSSLELDTMISDNVKSQFIALAFYMSMFSYNMEHLETAPLKQKLNQANEMLTQFDKLSDPELRERVKTAWQEEQIAPLQKRCEEELGALSKLKKWELEIATKNKEGSLPYPVKQIFSTYHPRALQCPSTLQPIRYGYGPPVLGRELSSMPSSVSPFGVPMVPPSLFR